MSDEDETEKLVSEALSALSNLSIHFEKRREMLPMYEVNKAWHLIYALTDREKRRQRIIQDLTPF